MLIIYYERQEYAQQNCLFVENKKTRRVLHGELRLSLR